MKRIRNILVSCSLWAFVVSFVAFIISAFTGYDSMLAWSGLIALTAFAVFFSFADFLNNDSYLRRCRRS